ncbi:MAG: hypothetical protein K9J81_08820 [Desulfohalobiaceae bacterium]|nr:hypothetical protein [Desulfohalobiaceae bacterium]
MKDLIYAQLARQTRDLAEKHQLLDQHIVIQARGLSVQEAIGDPEGDDFPLQKGKETLMQADFGQALGQAFTDRYGNYEGALQDVLGMDLDNNYRRALFVATLNALLRYLGLVEKTIHCRDQEPARCAGELAEYIRRRYGAAKIGQVGFQPRMVEALGAAFDYRVLDMDPDNIGTVRYGTEVEGPESTESVIQWSDLLLVTGTTLVNGSIGRFLGEKPVLFYGTTIAGAASLMGWDRFCACAT